MGTSIWQRTRPKHGLSHRRSTDRLRITPSVEVERQLSKVIGIVGWVFAFSCCSPHDPLQQGTRP